MSQKVEDFMEWEYSDIMNNLEDKVSSLKSDIIGRKPIEISFIDEQQDTSDEEDDEEYEYEGETDSENEEDLDDYEEYEEDDDDDEEEDDEDGDDDDDDDDDEENEEEEEDEEDTSDEQEEEEKNLFPSYNKETRLLKCINMYQKEIDSADDSKSKAYALKKHAVASFKLFKYILK